MKRKKKNSSKGENPNRSANHGRETTKNSTQGEKLSSGNQRVKTKGKRTWTKNLTQNVCCKIE